MRLVYCLKASLQEDVNGDYLTGNSIVHDMPFKKSNTPFAASQRHDGLTAGRLADPPSACQADAHSRLEGSAKPCGAPLTWAVEESGMIRIES